METLTLDKKFETREEMEEYEKKLCEEYIVYMITHERELTINEVIHFGKR